jgi:dihydroflavonol-4-reductase
LRNLTGLDVDIVRGNLFDGEQLADALQGCDVLYHVAAHYSTAEGDNQKMYEVNVRGTKAVLRAALNAGVQRAVHTSTIGTIGQPVDGGLATEATPFYQWNTSSHYAKSKVLGERVALSMCDAGLPVVVVNPCAPVGPGDVKPSSTGQRIVDYLQGKQPSFVPGGINFVSVRDVADGHVLAAQKGRAGERYILGHKDGNLMLTNFSALLEHVSGVPASLGAKRARFWQKLLPPSAIRRLIRAKASAQKGRAGTDFRPAALTCDPSKAIRELGLPQTPLEAAFAEAVHWFKTNGYVDG